MGADWPSDVAGWGYCKVNTTPHAPLAPLPLNYTNYSRILQLENI